MDYKENRIKDLEKLVREYLSSTEGWKYPNQLSDVDLAEYHQYQEDMDELTDLRGY